uniref:Lipocalin n=1 Tax=Rhipicephalus appendiculatus TaxID=34631 RepID=A0A131Z6S5_RHIAP
MNFVLALAFLSCVYAVKRPPGWKPPDMQDFTEMLDTGEQIYVTKRTYNEERVECVYWEKLAFNKTDYDFYKWYRKQPRPREWTKQGPQKYVSPRKYQRKARNNLSFLQLISQ